jgi:hypothetical protein
MDVSVTVSTNILELDVNVWPDRQKKILWPVSLKLPMKSNLRPTNMNGTTLRSKFTSMVWSRMFSRPKSKVCTTLPGLLRLSGFCVSPTIWSQGSLQNLWLDDESVVDDLFFKYLFLGSCKVSFFHVSIFLFRNVQVSSNLSDLGIGLHFLHQVYYISHLFVVLWYFYTIWYFYTTFNTYWKEYTWGDVEMMM